MSFETFVSLLFQALHLLGLLLWIGPSLGGYYMVRAARASRDGLLIAWVAERWQRVLLVEHLGLLLVLATGLARAAILGWLAHPPIWLFLKMMLVGVFVVPIELMDLWVAGFWVAPALRRPRDKSALARTLQLQDRFTAWTSLPLAATLIAILVLVVWKPIW